MNGFYRRESGNCRICYSADSVNDIEISLDTNKASVVVAGSICCGYGPTGIKINNLGAYDCLMIVGAVKTTGGLTPQSQCGEGKGLVTAANGATKTLCSM